MGPGLLPADAARAMAQWQHGGGFSVAASVRIEAADRARRERLLRYCARPPFALERLRQLDGEHLSYDNAKAGPGGSGLQILTPLELLDRLAYSQFLSEDRALAQHRDYNAGRNFGLNVQSCQ